MGSITLRMNDDYSGYLRDHSWQYCFNNYTTGAYTCHGGSMEASSYSSPGGPQPTACDAKHGAKSSAQSPFGFPWPSGLFGPNFKSGPAAAGSGAMKPPAAVVIR